MNLSGTARRARGMVMLLVSFALGGSVSLVVAKQMAQLRGFPFPWDFEKAEIREYQIIDASMKWADLQMLDEANAREGFAHYLSLEMPGEYVGVDAPLIRFVIYRKDETDETD